MAEDVQGADQDLKSLSEKFNSEIHQSSDQSYCYIPSQSIVSALAELKEKGFEVLTDLTAIDCLGKDQPARFVVIYQLLHSGDWKRRIRLRSRVNDDEIHPTVTSVFPAAGFAEREVWDMFGIVFEGNSNLKRLLNPDEFDGHPLRKDFPLQGRGYRDDFPNYHRDLLEKDD